MAARYPRVVVVSRETEYQLLLARHATLGQAEFFLRSRGQTLGEVRRRHELVEAALAAVLRAVPVQWRVSRVLRHDLDRFLFEPGDTVVAVGQDGLVANLAKYLDGQAVIGVNPDRERNEGVLVPHSPEAAAELIRPAAEGRAVSLPRVMAEARLEDGRTLLALNEVFVGVRTHQSARYRIRIGDDEERQSSSGLIVSTGTGATGWARSIHLERHSPLPLPRPDEERAVFFVREAWPSVGTGTRLTEGTLGPGESLAVTSEVNEGGVVFGDGIEDDHLPLEWGATVTVRVSPRRLHTVAALQG